MPTLKLNVTIPPPPDTLKNHFKGWRIESVPFDTRVWNPIPFARSTEMQDQFDLVPEFIDTLVPAYFCTPATKNGEPIHDSTTHYVAYEFFPKLDSTILRTTVDQFGINTIRTRRSELLMVPTHKVEFDPFCPILLPGSVNCDGAVTSSDIIYLVNYVFKGGLPPCPCPAAGDINCDGAVTSADIIALVSFVFKGGPPPCDPCTIIPGLWRCPC